MILSGCGEVNEWWVPSGFVCLPSRFVFIYLCMFPYLCMEIQAFLAGSREKHCLVSLGRCTYHSVPAGASIWLHQSKGDILQSSSTQSPWLVMAAQKQRDQEQSMSQRGNMVQMPKEEAGSSALRRHSVRSWRGIHTQG